MGELATIPTASNGQPPDVYRAICQAAKAISHDGIAKGKRNEQQGYSFRGIDDVYNGLSAILAGAGLCILPRMLDRTSTERTTAKGGVLFYVVVEAEYDFVSSLDGSKHTVKMYGEAMDSADKATNKAMSAAYKYACMQVFCIPTEGMDDADSTTPEVAAQAKLAGMKKAKAEGRPVRDAEPIYDAPPPPLPAIDEGSLHEDIRKFPPKEPKRPSKSIGERHIDMLQAFGAVKKRYQAIGMEKLYYSVLGYHGMEKSNQFPKTDSGLAQGLACYREMQLQVADLEIKQKEVPIR